MPILNTRLSSLKKDTQGQTIPDPSQVALQNAGPRIQVILSPLESQLKNLTDRGEPPPTPISGFALIDTGASSTCIDQSAAQSVGLAVVDSLPMTSATHVNEIVPIYAGKIEIIGISINVNVLKAYGANLKSQGLVALIGRDLLAKCVLVYNGPDSSFSLSI